VFFRRPVFLIALVVGLTLPFQAHAAILGDVNKDGSVSVADAVKLLREIVGAENVTDVDTAIGNVYPPHQGLYGASPGQQPLNIQDVIYLLKYTAGLVSPAELGINDQFVQVVPSDLVLFPLDQVQLTAVPFNVEGPVQWSLTSQAPNPGYLTADGIYYAPDQASNSFIVLIHARVGNVEGITTYEVDPSIPPPPPPPPGG
jgi:hypothetical protein